MSADACIRPRDRLAATTRVASQHGWPARAVQSPTGALIATRPRNTSIAPYMHTKITPLSIGRGRYLYVLLFIRRELSLVFGLQAAQAGFQLGEALVDNIRQILLIQIVRRAAFLVAHAHYLGGHAHGCAVGG